MRPITKLTICALATAAMAAPAYAASDYYLKLGDIKGESADRSAKGQIEIMSWSFGATNAGRVTKIDSLTIKQAVAAGDLDGDGRADAATTIVSPRDTASGMPTGKRQHGWVRISKPLDRGSVTVKGKFPGCTVGAAHSDAVLQTAAGRYELTDVLITSCSPESMSLNYAKVQVRGWDSAKKEN